MIRPPKMQLFYSYSHPFVKSSHLETEVPILIKELMTSVTLHQPWLSHSTKLHKIKQNNNHIGPFPSSYPESVKCLGNYQKTLNWIHKTITQLLNGKRG